MLDKLGVGGFGTVFRAKHKLMDRAVAIKVLHQDKLSGRDSVDRFLREVRAVARLEHPNIVKAYDADQSNGLHYLAMELVEGKVLHDVVKEKGLLPIATVIDYIRQVADGLDYAHRQGVVHRDIKPGNLILDPNGRVKILDMGLARLNAPKDRESDQLTQVGSSLGTSDFMAPEQAIDSLQADARSDIYSLGCTMYFLLVGDVLFPSRSEAKKIVDHHVTPPPSLRMTRTDVSLELDRIFRTMVSKSPDDRFQTMAEVLSELNSLSDEDDVGDDVVATPAARRVAASSSRSTGVKPKSAPPKPKSGPQTLKSGPATPPRSIAARSAAPATRTTRGGARTTEFIPATSPWYEPLTRPENRTYVIGGAVGMLFAVVVGSMFVTGPSQSANAKLSPNSAWAEGNVVASNPTTVAAPLANTNSVATADAATTAPAVATGATSSTATVAPSTSGPVVALHYSFDNASDGTTIHSPDEQQSVQGNPRYSHSMFQSHPATTKPMSLKMRETTDANGLDNRPGVLQLTAVTIPEDYEIALFKLGGEYHVTHFTLPHWKPRAVTRRNLEQTVVQINHRLVRANPVDIAPVMVSFSLEQNHSSLYEARLELDYVRVTGEWQTFTKRLSTGGRVDQFLAAMAENPDAGLQLVWTVYKQPFNAGDRIEIDEVKFLHEENAPTVGSAK